MSYWANERIPYWGYETNVDVIQKPQEKRNKGKWIHEGWEYRCSECGAIIDEDTSNMIHPAGIKFCPNCGAMMTGEDDGTD